MSLSVFLRRCAAAALLALSVAVESVAAAAPPPDLPSGAALQQQAHEWLRLGWDDPAPVLAALADMLARPNLEPAALRTLQRTRAIVAAQGGRTGEAAAALAALDALALAGDAMARPDAALARALGEEQQGRSARAVALAREAAESYAALCPLQGPPPAGCDPQAHWLALQTLLLRERGDAEAGVVRSRADAALALAQRAGDPTLQARTTAVQASIAAAQGDAAGAREGIARAHAQLRGLQRPDIEAWVWLEHFRTLSLAGDGPRSEQALAAALAGATRALSPRLRALVQTYQSDALVRRGRPAQALAAVEAALPVMRRLGDRRLERVLRHNAALAYIGLGRIGAAKAQADRLLEMWAAEATPGEQRVALREVADALAAAGDAPAALDIYHRERAVTNRLLAEQREAAEQALRARYDRDSGRRQIELRARDNAIQAAELQNRRLTDWLWKAGASAVLLAALLIVLLLRRLRATQATLRQSQRRLQQESERDTLTGAANRRHGQARLQAQSDASGAWRGAMLLIDVDHFKRINDRHGHGAGDEVLIEVARRLQAALRGDDVVLRWGGEEFLVLAAEPPGAALAALAARLMHAVGATPVRLSDGGRIEVTVSIGYGAFPLPPREQAIGWERALNLVDKALYAAKNQGRHRAVGVSRLADDEQALAAVEQDFERACDLGQVQLAVEAGTA
ncbi:MAG: GGDEF domain-containing protein [Burkholderiaceae bacterium]|nr:GGDEF domain-containing protein [Burkholderiaceae bacterium]